MEYRINRRTGDKVSVLGLGSGSITEAGEMEGSETLGLAFENGVNFFDLAASEAACFSYYRNALADVRREVLYQIHFGAEYTEGSYGWTTDLEAIKRSVDWQLETLRTDYIDYGFIHCIDEMSDWELYQRSRVLDYIRSLKRQGVVRHIGLSSHTPSVVHKIMDTGLVDMLMFSINPCYDYQQGDLAKGSVEERNALYRRCEAEGTGISVMKAFSGGQLLNAQTSPFGEALTQLQCIQYALDKPGVLTVLAGVRNREDLEQVLRYRRAEPEERDYSVIASFAPQDAQGKCVYCNHCQPCPQGLNVGLINKYYDLARAGDALAKEHYKKLDKKAQDCTGCGHCEDRCPFHVKQCERMEEIETYFKG